MVVLEDNEFLREFQREETVLSRGGCNDLGVILGQVPSLDGHIGLDR